MNAKCALIPGLVEPDMRSHPPHGNQESFRLSADGDRRTALGRLTINHSWLIRFIERRLRITGRSDHEKEAGEIRESS